MSSEKLNDFKWYTDGSSLERGEPGIVHSFTASLAAVLNYIDGRVDPVQLMGSTGFAFRIIVSEIMCPSAMSIFDWTEILPESVEQAGHDCYYISRLWHEEEYEEERRRQAHELVSTAVGNGIPAIAWDIADAEWGVIVGFDDDTGIYDTVTHQGKSSTLPYERLGKNGINIMSVTVPGDTNDRTSDEIVRNALTTAVQHGSQNEWMDRPKYQDGIPAYDLWAEIYKRWILLIESDKIDNVNQDLAAYAKYYSAHYFGARCYARDYLRSIALDNRLLNDAARKYERTAEYLRPLWEKAPSAKRADIALLKSFAENLKKARQSEEEGLDLIKQFLKSGDSSRKASISLE